MVRRPARGGEVLRSTPSLTIVAASLVVLACHHDPRDRIDALLEPLANDRTPGVSVMVIKSGDVVYSASRGMADIERGIPIGPRTLGPPDDPVAPDPRQLVAAFPSNPEAWAHRAYAALHFWFQGPSQERRAELEAGLEELRRLDPESPYLMLLHGYVSSVDGQPRDAIAAFSDLLERSDLTPGFRAMALGLRADREGDIGDPGAAERDLREALRLDPTRAKTLSRLSRLYRVSGRYDEAVASAQRVVALEPANFESYVLLGLTYTKAKKPAEATVAYRKAVKLSRSQYTLSLLSVSLLRERQKSEALEVAREAEALPDSQYGCYNLACARALAGERTRALAMLTRALALGFASEMIINDEDLASLHGDSDFEAIVKEVRRRIGKSAV